MNDKLTITLNIAGRSCVLTIEREEEEAIRKAAQLINSKIAKYREKYANADPIDFLAVTALQFTVKMLEAEKQNNIESVLDRVREISGRLDGIVKELG
ncbi:MULTISPECIES: cell division protein ZapA [Butyricimonas]|uniref:cell division protein ZapA n=1 Tax=Butyricimonas TaxID=574697 RepID=UPI0007FB2122|nr:MULTISPECIES: cell division protein ZapA [Butyricimonas]